DGIRDFHVTGVQTCALPISGRSRRPQGGGCEMSGRQCRRHRPDGRSSDTALRLLLPSPIRACCFVSCTQPPSLTGRHQSPVAQLPSCPSSPYLSLASSLPPSPGSETRPGESDSSKRRFLAAAWQGDSYLLAWHGP